MCCRNVYVNVLCCWTPSQEDENNNLNRSQLPRRPESYMNDKGLINSSGSHHIKPKKRKPLAFKVMKLEADREFKKLFPDRYALSPLEFLKRLNDYLDPNKLKKNYIKQVTYDLLNFKIKEEILTLKFRNEIFNRHSPPFLIFINALI